MIPEIGRWYRVTSGPHRGRFGVCDLVDTRPNGIFFRITNPQMIVGRFTADMLEPTNNPQTGYVSQVPADVTQRAMDLLTKGRSAS